MTEDLSYSAIFPNASGTVEFSNCTFFIYIKVTKICNFQTNFCRILLHRISIKCVKKYNANLGKYVYGYKETEISYESISYNLPACHSHSVVWHETYFTGTNVIWVLWNQQRIIIKKIFCLNDNLECLLCNLFLVNGRSFVTCSDDMRNN